MQHGAVAVDPSGSRYGIPHVVALVAAAVLGGAVALGGAAVTGSLGGSSTVREIVSSPAGSNPPVAFARGRALSINDIYQRAAPGVVQITSTTLVDVPQDPIFGDPFAPQQQQTQSLGSGFVIDKAGHVVTNYHVVEGATDVEVSFSSGERVRATIVGTDAATDLAVLKIKTSSRALTPLQWGNSDAVRVGDSVVAIGNPFGYTRSATSGIVSAIDRPLAAPDQLGVISHGIQTDAALNHGNSGGPLINAAGEVIGVNSQISTGTTGQEGNLGIGFAIPTNTVRNVVADLISHGRVDHAFLGISASELTPQVAELFNLPVSRGLLVNGVDQGASASTAGLRGGTTQVTVAGESWSLGGDIIVKADGIATPTLDKLRDVIAKHEPGDKMELVIYRGKARQTIEVTLGRQPSP
jgi:S1-C subfamily serine protease